MPAVIQAVKVVNHRFARGLAYGVPNCFVILRIIGAWPVTHWLVLSLERSSNMSLVWLAIFSLLALSDLADGRMTRQWHTTTLFGKLGDPLADKLMVFSALANYVIYVQGRINPLVVLAVAGMILLRLRQDIMSTWGYVQDLRRGKSDGANPYGQRKAALDYGSVVISYGLLAAAPNSQAVATVTAGLMVVTLCVSYRLANLSLAYKRAAT